MSTVLTATRATTPRGASPVALTRALTARAVIDRLTIALLVAAAMVGMGLVVGALWPPLQETFADLALPEGLLAFAGGLDLATPAGWVNAEMLSIVAPGALIAVAVVSAARATAGEEEAGTLGVLLSLPVTRGQVLFAKALAVAVHVGLVWAGITAGLLAGSALGDLGLRASDVLAGTAPLALLGLLFGTLALLVGSATGSRRTTGAVVGGLAVLAYATASFLPLVDSLADAARLSPWYYATAATPLVNGVDWTHLAVLGAGALLALAAALAVARRRDLRA